MVPRLAVDGTVVGSRAIGGVMREHDRDRTVAVGVGHLVVVGGVPTAVESVGVDLGDAGESVVAKMRSGLAHRLRGDLVMAGKELGVRNRERRDDGGVARADAVEVGDPLHGPRGPGELVEKALPDQVRNHDHRSAPGSWERAGRPPCG